ncbi:MAG: DUF3488 and transglutaminase-like domain-containing protein [Micromonosporaceae bacterium]
MVTPGRLRSAVVVPLMLAALGALSGVTLGRVYSGPLLAGLVAGAAAGAVLVSTLLRRAPAGLVAPISVLGLTAYALFAVHTSARAAGLGGDLAGLTLDAAGNAIPRLLTALIPVEAAPDTVLGPIVLAWLASLASAELAGRAARPGVALAPPVLLFTGAVVLVGPNAEVVLWPALTFAVLAAFTLAAATVGPSARGLTDLPAQRRAALGLRTATGLGTALLAALALAVLAAPGAAGLVTRAPVDPRGHIEPPSLAVLDQNPLIRLSGWAANPGQHLLDVVGPARPPAAEDGRHDGRLRLAVLADWDGVTWHLEADYRGAGRVLPAATDVGAPPAGPLWSMREQVTIVELDGRLLPAIATPRRVDGVRVAYDQMTGTLLSVAPLRPALTYTVTSVNPGIDPNLLPAADVPAGPAVARYLAVGDAVPPPDLSHLVEQIAAGEGSPYLRALALETFLSEHYTYAVDAPSGHAYPNLRFFLLGDARAGGQRGTSEQFATAFATLGRLLGLPTRVVVGFRAPAGGGPVRGGDALAWPEVLFSGVGWVPFDPMPDPQAPPQSLEDEFLPKPVPPTASPPAEPPSPPSRSASPPAAVAAAPTRPGAGAQLVGGLAGGVITVLVAFTVGVAALRALQRRRRRRGGPPRRILGAWDEVLDALELAGAPPPAHLGAGEVAEHAAMVAQRPARRATRERRRRPAPALHELAALVNAVSFAGSAVGGPAVGDAAAVSAARQAAAFAAAMRAARPWWRRLIWTVDPRPLRRWR